VSRFLTSDPQELDVTTALDEVLQDWSQPVLTGLRLEVSASGVESAGRTVLSSNSIDLGDLPIGRSVWVVGRMPRGSARDLGFRVLTGDGREAATCRVDVGGAARPGLKALFGARRVTGLEYLIASGRSGNELREQLERLGYGRRNSAWTARSPRTPATRRTRR
jgi:Ca-activated chloride channel family protein